MENKPLFTVLMPVFNAEAYLEEAIKSVLNQTIHDFELLIINDGSTDKSLKIINRFAKQDKRITVVSRPNRGFVASLNEGLRVITTELVARMDADDVSLPQRFEKQYTFMTENPGYSVVGCQVKVIDEKGSPKDIDPRPSSNDGLKLFLGYGCSLSGPTVMFRKSAIDAVGGFNEEAWPAEDYDCWTRLAIINPETKFHLLPDVLYLYRENSQGISLTNKMKQIKKTIEIGDTFRKAMIDKNWKFLTYDAHVSWFKDLLAVPDTEAQEQLRRIYYTAQIWFINDVARRNRLKAFLLRRRLMYYTKRYNSENFGYIFNQPFRHTFPIKDTRQNEG